jgi:hypothetical protein
MQKTWTLCKAMQKWSPGQIRRRRSRRDQRDEDMVWKLFQLRQTRTLVKGLQGTKKRVQDTSGRDRRVGKKRCGNGKNAGHHRFVKQQSQGDKRKRALRKGTLKAQKETRIVDDSKIVFIPEFGKSYKFLQRSKVPKSTIKKKKERKPLEN